MKKNNNKEEIEFISNKQVKEVFDDLIECGPEKRDELVNSYYKSHMQLIWIIILAVLLLINYKSIIYILREGELAVYLMFFIPVALVLVCAFESKSLYSQYKGATVYKREMYIYGKRIMGDPESYQFRFWDKDKYVLKKWFDVSEEDYKRKEGEPVTMYYIEAPKDVTIVFEFEKEKEVD
jgi:hypothetical protein